MEIECNKSYFELEVYYFGTQEWPTGGTYYVVGGMRSKLFDKLTHPKITTL